MTTSNLITTTSGAALLEKVLVQNDFAGLSSLEKVTHIKNVCDSLGLNPLTKPIQLIKFQNKEIPYFTKDATEQLRKINHVSLTILDTKLVDDIYLVIAEASLPDGRKDSATGAVTIGALKGEAKANAMMKAETKAKRRATLSICGLGFLDESEIDSMPHANFVSLEEPKKIDEGLQNRLENIETCATLSELEKVFTAHYKVLCANRDKAALKALVVAKDKRKAELMVSEFNAESEVTHETL